MVCMQNVSSRRVTTSLSGRITLPNLRIGLSDTERVTDGDGLTNDDQADFVCLLGGLSLLWEELVEGLPAADSH